MCGPRRFELADIIANHHYLNKVDDVWTVSFEPYSVNTFVLICFVVLTTTWHAAAPFPGLVPIKNGEYSLVVFSSTCSPRRLELPWAPEMNHHWPSCNMLPWWSMKYVVTGALKNCATILEMAPCWRPGLLWHKDGRRLLLLIVAGISSKANLIVLLWTTYSFSTKSILTCVNNRCFASGAEPRAMFSLLKWRRRRQQLSCACGCHGSGIARNYGWRMLGWLSMPYCHYRNNQLVQVTCQGIANPWSAALLPQQSTFQLQTRVKW